jgi:O-antigen ligase
MLNATPERFPLRLFIGYSVFLLLSIFGAIFFEEVKILILPVTLLFFFFVVFDFRKVYYILFALIPISMEIMVTDSLAISLPTEPVMISLSVIALILIFYEPQSFNSGFIRHPIIVMLLLHILWLMISLFYTADFLVSIKFLLAKLWFVGVFVFLTVYIIKGRKTFMPAFWSFFIPLIIITLYVLIKHAFYSFAFDSVNKSVIPFFRNHVNYAALLSIALPFAWFARFWYKKGTLKRRFIVFGLIVLFSGIVFSYTRAAWVAMILAVLIYYLIRLNILRYFVAVIFAGSLLFVGYMAHDNTYLDYAPNYESTIYHGDLGQHLEATIELQDLSSAERIYRWVAAFHMFTDRPYTGFGPGNFYPYYKHYTVLSFRTYVSENEEQSTVHNYYLLMLVEQGIVGFILFIGLVWVLLYYAEKVYHQTLKRKQKQYVMAIALSTVIILIHLLVSDLVEVDKIGAFFFLNMTLLVIQDLKTREKPEGKRIIANKNQ